MSGRYRTGIQFQRMQPILVDAEGEVWSVASSVFWMRPRQPDCHIVDYAISNLGFIYIWSIDGGSSIVVSLRPNLVHPKTMIAAFYEIADLKPSRVFISTPNATQHGWEVFNSLGRALDRIDRLVTMAWRLSIRPRLSALLQHLTMKDRACEQNTAGLHYA